MAYVRLAAFTLSTIFLISCSKVEPGSTDLSSRESPTYAGPAETAYCSSAISYSGSTITVTGTAEFQRREIYGTNVNNAGLGAPGSSRPIRRAEVRVLNSAGAVAQCATTDTSGQFSLVLPANTGSYTVYVNSRAYNNYLKASVLDAPERNQFYSLTQAVDSAAGNANITFLATATGAILGAPFNILDQMLEANEWLKTNAGTAACTYTGCDPFPATGAPKVAAYWEKGFNPNNYFGSSSGLSFYLPGYSRLFILGGESGDTDSSDTDHFDNSIILHEYGHFIEDVLTASDSPGGAHYGTDPIDPRLAWSEGWGNFLQAAIRNDAHYIDTYGNDDGSSFYNGAVFYVDLETASVSGYDEPDVNGEGNFREFSVTRLLWDVVDLDSTPTLESLNGGTDTVEQKFAEVWAALTSPLGFKNTNTNFRDIGLVHQAQATNIGSSSDWTDLRAIEQHVTEGYDSGLASNTERFRRKYALYVDNTASCTHDFIMTPVLESSPNSFSGSKLFRNNDFFFYKHPGGAFTVKLSYVTTSGTKQVDLDLFVYNSDAHYGYASDMMGYSAGDTSGAIGSTQSETVNVGSMSAGDYLINVKAWAGSAAIGGTATYHLEIAGGAQLCPAPQP